MIFSTMAALYRKITKCRVCGNKDLEPILDLGRQCLTGIFPKTKHQAVPQGPLELVKCADQDNPKHCGLVQLNHAYQAAAMYKHGYGYRSSLNQSMVEHLKTIVEDIRAKGVLKPGDLVIDIGSNDATLLKCYPDRGFTLVGVDPIGRYLKKYYPARITLLPDFFSARLVQKAFGRRKARVITSIAMFYDLHDPLDFMRQVREILDEEGIWVMEQSYWPTVLEQLAYDTICHEHLTYYGLKQIQWMAQKTGLNILQVKLNSTNGGSFQVFLAKKLKAGKAEQKKISDLLAKEERLGLSTLKPYKQFKDKIFEHREKLRLALERIKDKGKTVAGYGASTKGNVVLQFCGLTARDLPYIAEVNADKFGCFTPGTRIPIIPEGEARKLAPDYLLVLPWHFKRNIILREGEYLSQGGTLLFPLPGIEMHSGANGRRSG